MNETSATSHDISRDGCVHVSIHDLLPAGVSPNSESEAIVGDSDPDVIIPDSIARPLLVSSNLMLVVATLALALRSQWPLAAAAVFVWVTSLLHWYSPRFSSWRRILDYMAVCTYVGVGTWLALRYARSTSWTAFYFSGLALIGIIFTANETLYYLQLQRTPVGGRFTSVQGSDASDARPPLSAAGRLVRRFAPPLKAAEARRWAYRRTVWVHLFCVHVLASVLACLMVAFGLQ